MKNIAITLMVISIALFVVAASNAYVNYRQNKTINAIVDLIETNYELSEAQYQVNRQRIEDVRTQSIMTKEALDYAIRKGVKFD